jgi:hypothetical protein
MADTPIEDALSTEWFGMMGDERVTVPGVTMDGMGDNVAVFRLLHDSFPDEHLTSCIDTRVVSTGTTSREDPEDPTKTLYTSVYVLECPHGSKITFNVLLTTMRPPE